MATLQPSRVLSLLCRPQQLLAFAILIAAASAEALRCTTPDDTFIGNAEAEFKMSRWISRGICVRSGDQDLPCYTTLLGVLGNLNELRRAEYAGAAGILALLPTIGALLGTPTDEIWTLLTILPFGGYLAMTLSFGGAIMPVRIEDYEHAMRNGNFTIGSIITFRENSTDKQASIDEKLKSLRGRVSSRLSRPKEAHGKGPDLLLGLLGMILLFFGSQAAIVVLEQGGVLPWWCVSRWWMHLWYFMVTLTALAENFAQLPFNEQHKLYVSRVPYEISLSGGEDLLADHTHNLNERDPSPAQSEYENVAINIKQLETMTPAKLTIDGSEQYTASRAAVLVMVSVVGNKSNTSIKRLISKSMSIAVFVTGTAMFAAVTLVSLSMAVMALTLVLSAGVFGRAIAGWMVRRVSKDEPMIHVIVNDSTEAKQAICETLRLKSHTGADVQVEMNGHIFVNRLRVGCRSRWHVGILGALAAPFDLRTVSQAADEAIDHTPKAHLLPM